MMLSLWGYFQWALGSAGPGRTVSITASAVTSIGITASSSDISITASSSDISITASE